MKSRHKGIQYFLFMAFSVFLLVQPAFQEYEDLIEIELISPTPSLEKPHPEDLASGRAGYCQASGSNSLLLTLLPPTDPLKELLYYSFLISSPNQQAPVLSCWENSFLSTRIQFPNSWNFSCSSPSPSRDCFTTKEEDRHSREPRIRSGAGAGIQGRGKK